MDSKSDFDKKIVTKKAGQDDADTLLDESIPIQFDTDDVPKVVSDLLPKYQDSPDLFDSSFSQSQSSASEWEQSQPKKQALEVKG